MTDKALISEHTHRSLDSQRANAGDMPIFLLPEDLPQLFRPTLRKSEDRYFVDSLAIIAKKEDDFREFLAEAKKRKAQIISREDNKTFSSNGNCENLVKWWKDARRKGTAKIGAKISADNKKDIARKGIELIRLDWAKPSYEISTKALIDRSGLSLNTIKKYLGPRQIAQYNYRIKNKLELKRAILDPPPKKERPMEFCGLYVFQMEANIFKIGVSADANKRLKNVSAYQKKSMKVVALYNMEIEKAYALELEVHNRLSKYHAHEYNGREIFQVSLNTINRTIRKAMKHLFEVKNEA